MALYHKYRPQIFSEVLGQEPIVEILTNALMSGRVYHAYLFCGPRGLGKTTVARILAKAVNCENNIKKQKAKSKNTDQKLKILNNNFEPCRECQACLSSENGSSLDIIEIDAASNRGIDEIRELKEKSRFSASMSNRKKTFIIDEVHMLTKDAFNALLKTIEEPLDHLMFIMATTESHKIPATILSRVQRFDFKKPSVDTISKHIGQIAKVEKIDLETDAISILSKLSEGSFRDALSLLDQIKELKKGSSITGEDIIKNFGLARISVVGQLVELIINGNSQKALLVLEKMEASGVDPNHLVENIIEVLMDKLKVDLKEIYLKSVEIFALEQNNIKYSPLSYLPLKLAVFKIVSFANRKHKSGGKISETKPDSFYHGKLEEKEDKKNDNKIFSNEQGPKILDITNNVVNSKWTEIVGYIKNENPSLAALLESCAPEIDDSKLIINTRYRFHKDNLDKKNNLDLIMTIASKILDKEVGVTTIINPENCQKYFSVKEEELVKSADEIFN